MWRGLGKEWWRLTTLCRLVISALSNGRSYHRQGPQPLSHLPTISPTLDYPWRANLHAFNHLLYHKDPSLLYPLCQPWKEKSREKEMEGGINGMGGREAISCSQEKTYHMNSRWSCWCIKVCPCIISLEEPIIWRYSRNYRVREAETNEKEVRWEIEGSKMLVVFWETPFFISLHPWSRGARAASFEEDSSRFHFQFQVCLLRGQ